MKSDRAVPVAIIGAGFSGTMVAAQLARRGVRSLLIEPRDVAGRGTAFSTVEPVHLLNVPAGSMSAWPDAPDEFAAIAGGPDDFAERRRFGTYLRDILDEALSSHAAIVRDRAVAAQRNGGGWRIALESGQSVEAQALVLAIGNQLPDAPLYATGAGDRLIADPWGEDGHRAVAEAAARDCPVLIIGTGLTMIDVALSLDSAGHRGRILALSRRGLLPRSNTAGDPPATEASDIPFGNLRELVRWLRERSAAVGWREAVDSLRPQSHKVWQSLDPGQQRQFLRHVRPWWDIHRHRIAPKVARQLEERIAAGTLEIAAGRVVGVERNGDGLDVAYRRRGSDAVERERFCIAFNCTGPLHDIDRTRDPLLRQLLDDGLAMPDQIGIGLAVGAGSRVDGAKGLWALGALTKGRYWEIIAVPDIRTQAADVAEDIATELGQ